MSCCFVRQKNKRKKNVSYSRLLLVYDIQYNLYKYLHLLYLIEKIAENHPQWSKWKQTSSYQDALI